MPQTGALLWLWGVENKEEVEERMKRRQSLEGKAAPQGLRLQPGSAHPPLTPCGSGHPYLSSPLSHMFPLHLDPHLLDDAPLLLTLRKPVSSAGT